MSDDDAPAPPAAAGAPGWVMTFADLMSLLMCFFVLLLSFAEMNVIRFKQIAGSLQQAFGVQRDARATEIPKGTSVIAQEFSAGKPDPTISPEVKQMTTDIEKKHLDISEDQAKQEAKQVAGESKETKEAASAQVTNSKESKQQSQQQNKEQTQQSNEQMAKKIKESLEEELSKGQIEIETEDNKVIIRLLEQGFFPEGRAEFNYEFYPVLDKIRISLAEIPGTVQVIGHTDNQAVASAQFRSNWELSAARAVSVTQTLLEHNELLPQQIKLDPKRFSVIGKADTQPRAANDTQANRIKNRRIEIIVTQDPDLVEEVDDSVVPDDELLEEGWIEEQILSGSENDGKPAVKPNAPEQQKSPEAKAVAPQKLPAKTDVDEEESVFEEEPPTGE